MIAYSYFEEREEQLRAITHREGDIKTAADIPPELFPFDDLFRPIPHPTHIDDWLAQYNEERDSYRDWLVLWKERSSVQRAGLSTVYLRIVGEFPQREGFSLELLKDFVARYYPGVVVKLLPPLLIEEQEPGHYYCTFETSIRRGESSTITRELVWRVAHPFDIDHVDPAMARQFAVDSLLKVLGKSKPRDAFCVIGVTMEDLFEGKDDSFCAGMANGGSGEAIFSFARYDPRFGAKATKTTKKKKAPYAGDDKIILSRACKILVHELGHIYGIGHCVYFECCFNGSGHLQEDFRQPLNACPIELRKIVTITSCDVVARYRLLLAFYEAHGFFDEIAWTRQILARIAATTTSTIPPTIVVLDDSDESNDIDNDTNDDEVVVVATTAKKSRKRSRCP